MKKKKDGIDPEEKEKIRQKPPDTEGGEEEQPTIHRIITQLANPEAPWIAAVIGGFYYLLSDNPRPAVATVVAFTLLNFIARAVIKIIIIRDTHKENREAADKNPVNCDCGKEPTVYFHEEVDAYFIKCDSCNRQGDEAYFLKNAIEKWDDLIVSLKEKKDVE